MAMVSIIIILISAFCATQAAVTYTIPASAPSAAAYLDPAPIGISYEFFTFPSYFTNVTATFQCMQNFQELTGTWPPVRIGGTTQDRAQYDSSTSAYVVYSVASPTDAPAVLTYGSSFMSLAGTYKGTVVMGLNRGYGNIANTIAAAKVATAKVGNLFAIELGNEPEYWAGGQPITQPGGTWTPAQDAASQDDWDVRVGQAISTTNIISAGVFNSAPPTWGAAQLIATENATAMSYVKEYCHHNYPGGSVSSLMSHLNVANNVGSYSSDIAAANNVGKDYVFGETNSVSGGGAVDVSPTFGAGLWTMDYSLRASAANIKRLFFHHGTLGKCYYCWWGRFSIGAPYYGAYVAVAAMAHGSYISSLDTGKSNYAAYVIYDSAKKPLKALLYNSDYYTGGSRSVESFVLTGLTATTVRAKRLTALTALSRQDQGQHPTFGGQYFQNVTCQIGGTETFETTTVVGGSVTLTVGASEALLVYLE